MECFASRTLGLLASGLLLGLAACSTTSQPTTRYPVAHRGIEHSIERGVIVSGKEVIIDGQHSAVGIYTGAGVGGAVGSTLGSGTGSVLTSAAGAVAGAIGGAKVERELTSQKAQELIVRIEGGRKVGVVARGVVAGPAQEGDEDRCGAAAEVEDAAGGQAVAAEGVHDGQEGGDIGWVVGVVFVEQVAAAFGVGGEVLVRWDGDEVAGRAVVEVAVVGRAEVCGGGVTEETGCGRRGVHRAWRLTCCATGQRVGRHDTRSGLSQVPGTRNLRREPRDFSRIQRGRGIYRF